MSRHPALRDLALFAGGDLPAVSRWRVAAHVRFCSQCQSETEAFRSVSVRSAVESELPQGVRWDRLAEEMTANIRLGLEAGECVAAVRQPSAPVGWRAATVMAAMSILLLGAWYLNPVPRHVEHTLQARQIEIRNTSTGLELNEGGNALVLLHARGGVQARPLIVSAPGNLRARVVDADTGQITIHHVYAE